jgi:N-acetylneuraminate synthase
MEKLSIAGRLIGPDEPSYVIAEIGSNHNGDMMLCQELVDAARECGVDAVKFQSWSKSSLVSTAEYARNRHCVTGNGGGPTLEEQVSRYQLTPEQHYEIATYCKDRQMVFFSSCFSPLEVELLEALDVPAYKIASMDVNHVPLLEYVAGKRKPIILSTGLATLGEVERALDVLRRNGASAIALLHCVSLYPSSPEVIHLNNIGTLKRAFDVPVGYSDHSLGASIPLAAVALGACIIEKHFTLDKAMEGWDHAVSADPDEMTYIVRESKAIFAALGSPVRNINAAQIEKRKIFRRRLVTRRAIRKGDKLTPADFEFKRPGTGICPDELPYVVNRTVLRDLDVDEELEWADLA